MAPPRCRHHAGIRKIAGNDARGNGARGNDARGNGARGNGRAALPRCGAPAHYRTGGAI